MIKATISLQVVKEHYSHFAKKEATLRIRFGGNEITLNIPADGLVTKEGWRISPFSFPTVSQTCMNIYHRIEYVHDVYPDLDH